MKILLLGSEGQLGWELQHSLPALGEVQAVSHQPSPARRSTAPGIDLADAQALRVLVQRSRPDLIVNAAAFTAVDAAERDPQTAWAVNAVAPGVLATAAQAVGAALLHFSTEYVFSGAGHQPHTEEGSTGPWSDLSVYGRSKLEGELQVRTLARQSDSPHLILRTSWLYSARRPNFMRAILKQAQQGGTLEVVDDQIGAPTSAAWLAAVVAQIVPLWRSQPVLSGTYHATAAGAVSRLAWAQMIIESTVTPGATATTLRALSSADYAARHPGVARRPLNSRLDCTRLRQHFGITPPPWQSGVQQVLGELLRQQSQP
jgi:dTDP-4-dehydrorhamnose reductase